MQKKQKRKRDKEEFCQRFDESKVDVENVNTTKRALLAGRDRERTSAFPPQSRMESDKIDVSQKLCSLLLLMMMIGKKITRRTSSREMDHHVTIKKKWNRREKNVPMATAWTTPPLEIVLVRGDFFCLRVVVVTDVETGEEKRSCWCVANIIICVFLFLL